jgi:hypothetical protein
MTRVIRPRSARRAAPSFTRTLNSLPSWQARHGLTAAQYRRTVDALTAEGYRPILLDAYATDEGARFAAIFQLPPARRQRIRLGRRRSLRRIWERRTDRAQRAVHELNATEYQATLDALLGRGYRPVDASVFRVGRDTRYGDLQPGAVQPWVEQHGLDAAA